MANLAAPAAGRRSFLQAVSTVTEEALSPLRVSQMEGLVVEHCRSNAASHDAFRFVWDCLNQDDDDQTLLRDFRDFFDLDDFTCKEMLDLEESRESKWHRISEYPSEPNRSEDLNHEISSTLATSEVSEVSLGCTEQFKYFWPSSQESVTYTNDQSGISSQCKVYIYRIGRGTTENDSVTESLVMQETRKLSYTYLKEAHWSR